LVSGRAIRQNHFEIVADQSLGLPLGEKIRLGKDEYSVVGITSGMVSTGGDGMAFTTLLDSQAIQFDSPSEAIRLEREARDSRGQQSAVFQQQPQLTEQLALPTAQLPAIAAPSLSAVLVELQPGADLERVRYLIESWQDVSVYTTAGQEELLVQGIVDKARKQLFMFRVLLTIIAAIIMALIIYTLTLDKIYAIALLKLIGAPNYVILGMILQQALLLGGLGYLVAYIVGTQLFPLFPRRVVLTNEDLIQLAFVVLAISILSSLLGIKKAMQVEPNDVLMG
jgi:putative ABC transport system permease protein